MGDGRDLTQGAGAQPGADIHETTGTEAVTQEATQDSGGSPLNLWLSDWDSASPFPKRISG